MTATAPPADGPITPAELMEVIRRLEDFKARSERLEDRLAVATFDGALQQLQGAFAMKLRAAPMPTPEEADQLIQHYTKVAAGTFDPRTLADYRQKIGTLEIAKRYAQRPRRRTR